MGALFLWVPYLLLRKSPRRWWLYTAMAAVPFLCLTLLIAPVWIDPLFNTFGPMKNKALETRILQLADRAGIEGGRVYEVDKSTDTKTLNAYVAGVGGTKRIVLWDTIIARLDEPQLLFVMGHEMGHYVLNHIWKLLAVFSVLIAVLLYAVHRTAGAVIARQHARFGFTELSDVASLPLIMLLFSLAFLVVSPLALGITRHFEHEADRFGLEITRANRAGGAELRSTAGGQSGESAPALARAAVQAIASDAGGADRVRQQLPSLGDRAAADLRAPVQVRRGRARRRWRIAHHLRRLLRERSDADRGNRGDGGLIFLAGADPDDLLDRQHEDLAVADGAGAGGLEDRLHRRCRRSGSRRRSRAGPCRRAPSSRSSRDRSRPARARRRVPARG